MARVSRLLDARLLVAAGVVVVSATTAAPAWGQAAGTAPAGGATPPHKIAVEIRGPVAMVQVTRVLLFEGDPREASELVLDIALPEHAALMDLEVQDGARFRAAEAVDAARARDQYAEAAKARSITASAEPFDESAAYRLRVARAGTPSASKTAAASVTLRYRFSALADWLDGRYRLRFPGAPERLPSPADVNVAVSGAGDVEIAGARTAIAAGAARGTATAKASTRSGWEVSWAPRGPAAADGGPSLEAVVAAAPLSAAESAVAFAVHGRGGKAQAPPASVLFVVDRSRSVGLPGLSAERDVVRRLLETLPPTTRFDVLFFDRGTKRLFPMQRPATREAIAAFESEMVPDRLLNGTDLVAALKDAAALLGREASAFGPRALLAIVTDGALADEDGAALDHALGSLPGLELPVAAFAVRAQEDEPVPAPPRQALRLLIGARGGLYRELRPADIQEGVPAALAALGQGGDVASVRLVAAGHERALAEGLGPGEGLAGIARWSARAPRAFDLQATVRGHRTRLAARPQAVDAAWLRPHLAGGATARLLTASAFTAMVEPVLHPDAPHETPVRGSMDRLVVRNTLSLAYMPRARACYLNRKGATPALRDLAGRVRLAIDLVRGEVARAKIESSTLNHPEIEGCLRDGAFAIEVPRAIHSDAPVTAILNLVFRPRTPDKKHDLDDGTLGDQIDLIIEDLHKSEQSQSNE